MIYVRVCLIKMLNLVAHSPCQQRNFYDLHIYSTPARLLSFPKELVYSKERVRH